MGKLRIEPKKKQMDTETYRRLWNTLREARSACVDNRVFYDLDSDEKAARIRKDLMMVADKEGLDVQIRSIRNQHSLELKFGSAPAPKAPRISSDDYRERVVAVLREAGGSMKKGDILGKADLSGSTWNIRIKELLNDGIIKRTGERRDAAYSLVEKPKPMKTRLKKKGAE